MVLNLAGALRFVINILVAAITIGVALFAVAVALGLGWVMIGAGWLIRALEYISGERR